MLRAVEWAHGKHAFHLVPCKSMGPSRDLYARAFIHSAWTPSTATSEPTPNSMCLPCWCISDKIIVVAHSKKACSHFHYDMWVRREKERITEHIVRGAFICHKTTAYTDRNSSINVMLGFHNSTDRKWMSKSIKLTWSKHLLSQNIRESEKTVLLSMCFLRECSWLKCNLLLKLNPVCSRCNLIRHLVLSVKIEGELKTI